MKSRAAATSSGRIARLPPSRWVSRLRAPGTTSTCRGSRAPESRRRSSLSSRTCVARRKTSKTSVTSTTSGLPTCLLRRAPRRTGQEAQEGRLRDPEDPSQTCPQEFESDRYSRRQKKIIEELQTRRTKLATELEKTIEEKGFKLLEVQYGPFTRPAVLPVIEQQPVEMEKLAALVDAKKLDGKEYERIKRDHDFLVETNGSVSQDRPRDRSRARR